VVCLRKHSVHHDLQAPQTLTQYTRSTNNITVVYCGLVVHMIDTGAQKMITHTVAHHRIGVCTWPAL